MTTELGLKPLPILQKAFTITANMTFREYLAALSTEQRQFMQMRQAEVRLPPTYQDFLLNYPDVLNIVVLVADDAPETAIVLPVIEQIAVSSPRLVVRILRDTDDLTRLEAAVDDLELDHMNEVDLPRLFIFDEEWNWQAQWGPQPEGAEAYLDAWLEAHPTYERLAESDDLDDQDLYWQLTEQLLHEMRMWYNSTLDKECVREVCDLLATLNDDSAD
jgi:hypothetical protein